MDLKEAPPPIILDILRAFRGLFALLLCRITMAASSTKQTRHSTDKTAVMAMPCNTGEEEEEEGGVGDTSVEEGCNTSWVSEGEGEREVAETVGDGVSGLAEDGEGRSEVVSVKGGEGGGHSCSVLCDCRVGKSEKKTKTLIFNHFCSFQQR